MTSYNIWVPSIQRYVRFLEMNGEQYRNIHKVLDDDSEFSYYMNSLLKSNCLDNTIDIFDFTIIDKFVIILQLKIHSCGSVLTLSKTCSKCMVKTTSNIDLNNIIESLAGTVDRSFAQTIVDNDIKISCDIPTIRDCNGLVGVDEDTIVDDYLFSYIKEVSVNDIVLGIHHLPKDDPNRRMILKQLPFTSIRKTKVQYVDNIHKIFSELIILNLACSNKKCNDATPIPFSTRNLDDIIRIIFRDDSLENILMTYAGISSRCHFDYNFYKNLSPLELELISKAVKASNKQEQEHARANNDTDLFEQYSPQTINLAESPSEFP